MLSYAFYPLPKETRVCTSGEDAWVHKGSHAKVGQGEEKDNDVVDRNGRRETLGQPRTTIIREKQKGRH